MRLLNLTDDDVHGNGKIALRPTCVAVANPDDLEVRSCQMVQNVLLLPPPPSPPSKKFSFT